jgi:hypothetical protein
VSVTDDTNHTTDNWWYFVGPGRDTEIDQSWRPINTDGQEFGMTVVRYLAIADGKPSALVPYYHGGDLRMCKNDTFAQSRFSHGTYPPCDELQPVLTMPRERSSPPSSSF